MILKHDGFGIKLVSQDKARPVDEQNGLKEVQIMRHLLFIVFVFGCQMAAAGTPALTIYDQGFAVVSESVPLELKAGLNELTYSEMTGRAESDSVLLRATPGGVEFRVIEQTYVNDAVSQDTPAFHQLEPDATLRPTVRWVLEAPKEGAGEADLSYITTGIGWDASYNILLSETSDELEMAGWVKVVNASGKTFENAAIELMAVEGEGDAPGRETRGPDPVYTGEGPMAPPILPTENGHYDYKRFTLQRPTTLRDKQSKEIEYLHATGIGSNVFYLYVPGFVEHAGRSHGEYRPGDSRQRSGGNTKVWVMREIQNTAANHLGMPLPGGRLRLYQAAGPNKALLSDCTIDCIPPDGAFQVFLGSAPGITGNRRLTNNVQDRSPGRVSEETYEIELRSQKPEPVQVRVMEELNLFKQWEIKEASDIYKKLNDHTVEFRVQVVPNEKKTITYTVRYESVG